MASSIDTQSESESRQSDSNYGVKSLADTLEAAFGEDCQSAAKATVEDPTLGHKHAQEERLREEAMREYAQRMAESSSKQSESSLSPPRKHKRKTSDHTTTNPLPSSVDVSTLFPTPNSAMPGSTPRSLSMTSLKLSDEEYMAEDAASQAVASSSDEDEDEDEEDGEAHQGDSSFPQLVMPSIQMPARRPFTANGRAMGKLKVLIAGASGMPLPRSPLL